MTGILSWIGIINALASVVMMQHEWISSSAGDTHRSLSPANPNSSFSSRGRMK
jgi:hypothetical protein